MLKQFPLMLLSFSLTPTVQYFFMRRFFSVVSSILSAIATPTEWKFDIIADQGSGAVLANSIAFNPVAQLLLAVKFLIVDFRVVFLQFDMNVGADLGAYIDKMGKFWSHPSWE